MADELYIYRSIPIHILGMDTGQPHPLASVAVLQHDVRDNFTEIYPPYLSVSQSVVAILFRESGQAEQVIDEDRLFVWNWRTGSKILVSFPFPSIPVHDPGLSHLFVRQSLSNTYYETLTLLNNTWLVAGYAFRPTDDRYPDNYALHLMETSTEPIKKTRFELSVPSYGDHGHFAGLHSGESAIYETPPSTEPPFLPVPSEAIITARIQMCDTTTDEHAAYCVTLRLCELLKLAKRGQTRVPWAEWEPYTSIWEKKGLVQHIFSDFCVSGWRLACPLVEVEADKITFEIHEFNSRCGSLVSLSNGNSSPDTDPTSPTEGDENEKKVVSNFRSSKRVKELVFKHKEGIEDLTSLSTNVMITEDNLILVTVNQQSVPLIHPRES